jgi:hypothetical protein
LAGAAGVVALILRDDVAAPGSTTPAKAPVDPDQVGRLVVRSKPSGCDIYLNGSKQEGVATSAHLEVPVGPVTVRVSCKDHEGKVVETKVSKDKAAEVNVVLDRKK